MKILYGKVALVSGASRGIGRAVALYLAEMGATVAVNYASDKVEAEKTVAEIVWTGGNAVAVKADVSSERAVAGMVSAVTKKFGNILILVHNASPGFKLETVEDAPWDSYEKYLGVYVRGGFNLIQAVLPGMKEKKYGKIVTILSAYAFLELPKKAAPYVTAKEALWGLTKAAAADLASYGIRVNAVSPGFVDTETSNRAFPPRYKEMVAARSPVKRVTTPEDVARAVGYLAGPESDHLTGTNTPVEAS